MANANAIIQSATGALARADDYKVGDEPLLVAHLTQHPGTCNILGLCLLATSVLTGFGQFAPAIALALWNDSKYVNKGGARRAHPPVPSQPQAPPSRSAAPAWLYAGGAAETSPPQSQEASQELRDGGAQVKPWVGTTTRLTRVEAAAESGPEPATSSAPSQVTSEQRPSLPEDLARQIKNILVAGKGGSGKGMLVSNAGRAAKRLHPDTLTCVIDLKDKPEERSYWEFADSYCHRNCRELDPAEVWDWIESCMREFQRMPAPKLLIVDEIKFLSASLGLVKEAYKTFWHIINAFTSLGDADGVHVWLMTQATHAKAIGDGGADLGQFRVIALVDSADVGYYDTLISTNAVQGHSSPSFVKHTLMSRSPVGRVYFDSKTSHWYALSQLENYSQIDRDKGILYAPHVESTAEPQTVVYLPQAKAPVGLDRAPDVSIDPRLQKVADIFISDMKSKGYVELAKGKVFKELPTIRKHVRVDENSNDGERVANWTRALIRASKAGLITYREGENTSYFGLVGGAEDAELSHLFFD